MFRSRKIFTCKLSVGVVSLAIAGLLPLIPTVKKWKQMRQQRLQLKRLLRIQQQAMQQLQQVLLTSTTVTEGNKTVTTTYRITELESKSRCSYRRWITVTEEVWKVQPSITAAEADNKAQTAEINTVVENYKKATKLSMKQKSQEITLIEKRMRKAKQIIKKKVAEIISKRQLR